MAGRARGCPTEQFQPLKSFKFPKRSFGSNGEERSFCAEWCEKFSWLHYEGAVHNQYLFVDTVLNVPEYFIGLCHVDNKA